jgi:hypothetical protein
VIRRWMLRLWVRAVAAVKGQCRCGIINCPDHTGAPVRYVAKLAPDWPPQNKPYRPVVDEADDPVRRQAHIDAARRTVEEHRPNGMAPAFCLGCDRFWPCYSLAGARELLILSGLPVDAA